MVARTKRGRRGYSAGEWGRNRVRVYPDPRTGVIQIEWREDGRRTTRSLGHRDWARAKRQADKIAAGLARPVAAGRPKAAPKPLTLKMLLDIYGEEVTPTKSELAQKRDRVAMRMFLEVLRQRSTARNPVPAGLGPGSSGSGDGAGSAMSASLSRIQRLRTTWRC